MKIKIKLLFLGIDYSSKATGGAPGGWWVGRGMGNSDVGEEQRGGAQYWGVNSAGGSTVGVFSTSQNRPSHRKYKFQKQFELKTELKGPKST